MTDRPQAAYANTGLFRTDFELVAKKSNRMCLSSVHVIPERVLLTKHQI